jgi:uroporphyrinogen-III synthase
VVNQKSPLANRRILITRTAGRASSLSEQLEANGAIVVSIPTIEIIPPESYAPLDEAMAHMSNFDWIVFTSAHAVEVFRQRYNSSTYDGKIAVIGPATARAVEQAGFTVSLQASRSVAESLAESLAHQAVGKSFLLIRAAEARDIIPLSLTHAGGHVTMVDAYRNRLPEGSIPQLRQIFSAPEFYPDAITFTSASTARNLIDSLIVSELKLPSGIVLASIGPITSQALRDLHLEPSIEATEATIPALVAAILQYFQDEPHC